MEFSAAPLWKSWHAVSLLPDGRPLGSCFHGALFARQPDRCWGIWPPLVCKQNAEALFNKNLGPVCLWLTVESSVTAAMLTQERDSQGTNNKSILYNVCRHCNPHVGVFYLTTQRISLYIKHGYYIRNHTLPLVHCHFYLLPICPPQERPLSYSSFFDSQIRLLSN